MDVVRTYKSHSSRRVCCNLGAKILGVKLFVYVWRVQMKLRMNGNYYNYQMVSTELMVLRYYILKIPAKSYITIKQIPNPIWIYINIPFKLVYRGEKKIFMDISFVLRLCFHCQNEHLWLSHSLCLFQRVGQSKIPIELHPSERVSFGIHIKLELKKPRKNTYFDLNPLEHENEEWNLIFNLYDWSYMVSFTKFNVTLCSFHFLSFFYTP